MKTARPLLLACAFALVAAMAATSPLAAHPDEGPSAGAVRSCEATWFPADIRSPAAAPSFSPYGVSRLDGCAPYWFFAGRFSAAARVLFPKWSVPERAFNVVLFAALLSFCLSRSRRDPWMLLPVCISPQVWYLFSYCTSDALDVALSAAALGFAARPESLRGVRRICAAGLVFGLAALGKPTILAAFLVCGVLFARALRRPPFPGFRRSLLAAAAVALA
ncbi:MAG: DUF2142 domain-containing protein, partial [Kiritimatiellae bacterium]|nr:DUF2142 domain-containing protein [Kiritimatiellia bacterium]